MTYQPCFPTPYYFVVQFCMLIEFKNKSIFNYINCVQREKAMKNCMVFKVSIFILQRKTGALNLSKK